MVGWLTDAIDNGLSVIEDLVEGDAPSRRQVAQLISDGITVAAIATATGQSVEFIESLIED